METTKRWVVVQNGKIVYQSEHRLRARNFIRKVQGPVTMYQRIYRPLLNSSFFEIYKSYINGETLQEKI